MPNYGQELNACLEDGIIKFPAFVHLPSSSRHEDLRIVPDNESVKLITLRARLQPNRSPDTTTTTPALATCWKQIATRWDIHEDRITALTVPLSGQRVLIETDVDWDDWVATYFFEPTPTPPPSNPYPYNNAAARPEESRATKEFTIKPIHIKVLVDPSEQATPAASAAPVPQPAAPAPTTTATGTVVPSLPTSSGTISSSAAQRIQSHVDVLQQGMDRMAATMNRFNAQYGVQPPSASSITPQEPQQPQAPTQPRTQTSSSTTPQTSAQANQTNAQARATPSLPMPASALASNIVGTVLQALQPQLREVQPLVSSILSSLPAQMAAAASAPNATRMPPAQPATSPTANDTAASSAPSPASTTAASAAPAAPATPAASVPAEAVQQTPEGSTRSASQQRQSLMEGMFDELSRLRSQQQPSTSQPPEGASSTTQAEGELDTELTQAFAQMIAQQRSTTAAEEDQENEEQDESLTIVSTPSTSSRRSSRSRSRSPRRAGNRTILSTTTLFLSLVIFFLAFISSALASPSAVNPSPLPLNPRSPITDYPTLVTRGQNSRNLHLCKCTCFQTNSTLVPLYSPLDAAKPCSTCTRQFCLDQGLEICKGAKLEHTDHDTGTGLEGDVWAKCFERDSGKDQSIITLYLLVVVGLVAFAAFRGRVEGWVRRYEELGPSGLYSAVRDAPWRRGR